MAKAGHQAARLREATEFVGALSESLHPERVAEVLVEHAMQATGARAALLAHVDGDPAEFVRLVSRGFGADADALCDGEGAPLRQLAAARAPVFVDADASRALAPPSFADGSRPRALAFLPLVTRRRVVGALALAFDEPAPLRPSQRAFVELLCAQGALALERAKLHLGEAEARDVAEDENVRFRSLVHEMDAVLWEAEPETLRFEFVSQRAEKLLGFPPEAWLAPGFLHERLHEEDREWALDFCARSVLSSQDHALEFRMMAADGRVVWLRDLVYVLRDEDGRPTRLRGVMMDITKQRESELDRIPFMRVARRLIRGRGTGPLP